MVAGRLTAYDPATGEEKGLTNRFSLKTIAQPVSGAAFSLRPQPCWEEWPTISRTRNRFGRRCYTLMQARMAKLPAARSRGALHFRCSQNCCRAIRGSVLRTLKTKLSKRNASTTLSDGLIKTATIHGRDEFFANLKFDRGKPKIVAIRPGRTGEVIESQIAWELR